MVRDDRRYLTLRQGPYCEHRLHLSCSAVRDWKYCAYGNWHPHYRSARAPRIGRDCIVQLKKRSEGDTMRFLLKRLVKRTGAKWTFRQFNPEKDIVLDDREIQAVHLILKNHEMLRS